MLTVSPDGGEAVLPFAAGAAARAPRVGSSADGPPDWMSWMSMTVPSPSRLELVGGKGGDRHVPVRSPGRRSFCRTRPLGLVKVSAENRAQADPALSGEVDGQHLVVEILVHLAGGIALVARGD